MLHLYRRHLKSCPHKALTYRRCQCPIMVKGTLAGDYVKKSLDMHDMAAAQKLIGDWVKDGKVGPLVPVGSATISETVEAFLKDTDARGLAKGTTGKYANLLKNRLIPWAATEEGTNLLRNLNLDVLTRFRATWPDAPLAKQKNQERLRAFFRWCVARGWLSQNPTEGLTAIKVKQTPTLPFTPDELVKILDACDRYPQVNNCGYDNRARVKAFVLALRWSGLRIRDVVTLAWDKIEDGKLRLYTQKTGQHVYVPLPPVCVEALEAIRGEGSYIFWTGRGDAKSAVGGWQRTLGKLFELTDVENGHAHRFRDTFAVELLLKGVELSDVSILLGHSTTKITERHYAPWVHARQVRLESIVRNSWQTESAPETPASPPSGEPARRQIAVSASHGQTSPLPARTGSDDARNRRSRSTLRLVRGECNGVQ